jgi:DNA mismatch endonuclease (patch repair protein)
MDKLTPSARSRNMSRIRSRDTSPELTVRKALHSAGLRFRLHAKHLPGKPDLVFPSRRACVFVHGCFWHGCPSCVDGTRRVKSNFAYWSPKIEGNRQRDARHLASLLDAGWKVFVIWECQVREINRVAELTKEIKALGQGGSKAKRSPTKPSTRSRSKKQPASSKRRFTRSPSSKRAKSAGAPWAKPKALNSPSPSRSAKASAASSPLVRRRDENGRTIIQVSAADLDKLPRRTDWTAFDALTDADIAKAVASDPDAVPVDLDWSKAKLYYPKGKAPLSIRIDPDVLAFFKATGRRYQTPMNAVLRAYMEHETGKK